MSGHGRAAAIPRRARSWIAAAVLARATAWSPPRRTKPLPVIPCRPSRRTAAAEAAARCLGRTAIHSRRAMMNGHRSVADGRAGVNATVVRPPALSQPPHLAADRLHTSALSPCLALPCLADSRPRSDGWLHRRRLLSATVSQLLIAVLADDIFGRSLWVMSAITVSGM